MILEKTWGAHPTQFVWTATTEGVCLYHGTIPPYIIPWKTFFSVLMEVRSMASASGGVVVVGANMTSPPRGSVGAWVIGKGLPIRPGKLTPKHLSFMGPILGHMDLAKPHSMGKAIRWKV